jgi:hypothetical protein
MVKGMGGGCTEAAAARSGGVILGNLEDIYETLLATIREPYWASVGEDRGDDGVIQFAP